MIMAMVMMAPLRLKGAIQSGFSFKFLNTSRVECPGVLTRSLHARVWQKLEDRRKIFFCTLGRAWQRNDQSFLSYTCNRPRHHGD